MVLYFLLHSYPQFYDESLILYHVIHARGIDLYDFRIASPYYVINKAPTPAP